LKIDQFDPFSTRAGIAVTISESLVLDIMEVEDASGLITCERFKLRECNGIISVYIYVPVKGSS
jgi:hypothetical protein